MNALFLSPGKKSSSPRAGFTLIEMLVTLSVFIALTASVFGILTAVLQSSSELQSNQNRRDEVSALGSYIHHTLQELTATDSLVTYRRDNSEGLTVNGIIASVSGAFEALDATRQANGLYQLRLARSLPDDSADETLLSFTQKLQKDPDALAWTPLLRDVRLIGWRFRQDASPDWEKEWTAAHHKPSLVECTIQLAGDDLPTPIDFQIPHFIEISTFQATPAHAP